jgi:carbon monoxide dehydrogenase subunit G
MKLDQSFNVTAPIEQVWSALVDVERIAPCLPGAEITGQSPDGAYEGTFTVKLGPTTAAYRGSLRMESLDEVQRVATMAAKGTDKRGQGGANASIVSTLREEGEETRVDVVTDFTITGRLARFGRGGMIEDISKRLMRDFAQCLQSTLAAEQVAPSDEVAPAAGAAAAAPAAGAAAPAEPQAGGAPGPEDTASAPDEATVAEAAAAAPLPGQEAPDHPSAGGAEPAAPAAEPSAPRSDSVPPTPAPRPAAQPAKPIKGFSLFFSVLWERIKRFFSRFLGRQS